MFILLCCVVSIYRRIVRYRPHILSVWPFTLVCASAFGGRRNRRDQWYIASVTSERSFLTLLDVLMMSSIQYTSRKWGYAARSSSPTFFFLWWWWFSLLLYIFPLYTLFMKSDTSLDRLKDYRWRVPLWLYCASNLNRSRIPTHCSRKHEQTENRKRNSADHLVFIFSYGW